MKIILSLLLLLFCNTALACDSFEECMEMSFRESEAWSPGHRTLLSSRAIAYKLSDIEKLLQSQRQEANPLLSAVMEKEKKKQIPKEHFLIPGGKQISIDHSGDQEQVTLEPVPAWRAEKPVTPKPAPFAHDQYGNVIEEKPVEA